jgi:hypothetical protein
MAEPFLSTNEQPRLEASNTIDKDQLRRQHHLARAYGLPFFRGDFDIKDDCFIGSWFLDIIERQLAPIVDLPGIKLHGQIAKNRHTPISHSHSGHPTIVNVNFVLTRLVLT